MSTFEKAFADARAKGLERFWWNRTEYTTERADGKPLPKTAAPQPPAGGEPEVQRFWCHEARNIRCVREADYDERCTAYTAVAAECDYYKAEFERISKIDEE